MDKGTAPLISVIIPVYNVEKYLPDCLDSLLAQTYQNFELLCVNDGSPDNSQAVLERYARRDSRVKVFRKANGGVSSARNLGLERAQGAYITFVDPDDFVAAQYLEEMARALQESGAQIAFCGYKRVSEAAHWQPDPSKQQLQPPAFQALDARDYSFDAQECPASCLSVWRVLFCKEVLNGLRFDESLSMGEDTVYLVQAIRQAQRLVYTEQTLYAYRLNQNSACTQTFAPKHYTVITAREEVWCMAGAVSRRMQDSAEEFLVLACLNVYTRMVNAHYPDKALRASTVQKVREHRDAVRRMKTHPRWKLWDKTRLLGMLYLPAWFNGPVWRAAERLRAKQHGMDESL